MIHLVLWKMAETTSVSSYYYHGLCEVDYGFVRYAHVKGEGGESKN